MFDDVLVYEAFTKACEDEEGVVVFSDNVVRDDVLLKVDWPRVRVVKESMATLRTLIKALSFLQINAFGHNPYYRVLVLDEGVRQCFPLMKDTVIDFEKKRMSYTGKDKGKEQVVNAFQKLNEFFLKAATEHGCKAVNMLYTHIIALDGLGSFLKNIPRALDEIEEVLNVITQLTRRRLVFVWFRRCILAKVTTLEWYKEKSMFLCISKRGVSTPKPAKRDPSLDLIHLLWRIRNKDYPVKYTWQNPKSAKPLYEFFKMAQTVDVAGRERIINEFLRELPVNARASLLGEIV